MIHRCALKSKETLLLLSLSFFLGLSCENDEPTFNPLLASVQVSAGFIGSFNSQRVYLLASDSKGNVLEYRQLENDETFELNSSSYAESTFTLSFVETIQYTTGAQQKYLTGKSFHGIKRGSKLLLKNRLPGNMYAGFSNFTAQNFDDNMAYHYTISSNGYGSTSNVSNPNTQSDPNNNQEFGLYSQNPTRLFVLKYDANQKPLGYLFPSTTYTVLQKYEISVGGNYSPMQTEVIHFPEFVSAGVTLYGRPAIDNYRELYEVSRSSTSYNNPLTIYYPGSAFPVYASRSWLYRENSYFENFNTNERSDFDFLKIEARLTISGQTISYSLSGGDGIALFDFNFNISDNEIYNWNSYASVESNGSITLPMLPAEITSNFASYSYDSWRAESKVEILQLIGVTTLEEYAASKANGTWLGFRNYKYTHVSVGNDLVGERGFRNDRVFFEDGF